MRRKLCTSVTALGWSRHEQRSPQQTEQTAVARRRARALRPREDGRRRRAGRHLRAVHISIDVIEDALLVAGLEASWTTGAAAYEAAGALSGYNLRLGNTVVVDAVNGARPARETWQRAAAAAGDEPVHFLLRLQDRAEHRRRLEGRQRPFVRVAEPKWDQVVVRASAYEAWPPRSCTVLDAHRPVNELVPGVIAALSLDGQRLG